MFLLFVVFVRGEKLAGERFKFEFFYLFYDRNIFNLNGGPAVVLEVIFETTLLSYVQMTTAKKK